MAPHERLSLILPYVHGARQIVRRCRINTVREYWKYLMEHGLLAHLTGCMPNGSIAVDPIGTFNPNSTKPAKEPLLFITALVFEDLSADEEIARFILDPKADARFFSRPNLIALKSWLPETSFMRGYDLLHEAAHAWRVHSEDRLRPESAPRTEAHVQQEELEIQRLGLAIWREWAGPRFEEIIAEAVEYVQQQLEAGASKVRLPIHPKWSGAMDTAFGLAPTLESRERRLVTLGIFAHIIYCDQTGATMTLKM